MTVAGATAQDDSYPKQASSRNRPCPRACPFSFGFWQRSGVLQHAGRSHGLKRSSISNQPNSRGFQFEHSEQVRPFPHFKTEYDPHNSRSLPFSAKKRTRPQFPTLGLRRPGTAATPRRQSPWANAISALFCAAAGYNGMSSRNRKRRHAWKLLNSRNC